MKYRTRKYYTASQKALMWDRWRDGWTLHQIGQLFDRPHTSIHNILSKTGGIRPPERRRCATALTLAEREEISRSLMAGQSMRSVAVRLGRAPSTVSREIVSPPQHRIGSVHESAGRHPCTPLTRVLSEHSRPPKTT